MPSLFKAVIEPAIITGIFTAGCLINREWLPPRQPRDIENQPPHLRIEDDSDSTYRDGSPSSSSVSSSSASPSLKPVAQTTAGEVDAYEVKRPLFWELLSRFWNTFPFLPEIWYWNLTLWVYQLLRAFSARMIAGNQPIFALARTHALQILSFERFLSIDVELGFQTYILDNYPDIMLPLARIYHSHICVGVAFIVYCYTYLPRHTFYRIRRTIALDNVIAFFIVTTWRCSPPRLLPPEYGYVDVLHKKLSTHDNAWTNNRFQLTIAAMPSLHFGTALFLAVCLCRFSPHGPLRALALLWPVAMLVTIVATANHFLMDALVGALIPLVGWRCADLTGTLHTIELWVFKPFWSRMNIVEDLSIHESSYID